MCTIETLHDLHCMVNGVLLTHLDIFRGQDPSVWIQGLHKSEVMKLHSNASMSPIHVRI